MKYDYNQFAKSLDAAKDMDVKDENNGKNGWVKWSGSSSSSLYNQVIEFEYDDSKDDEQLRFRSWYMETSVMKSEGGMIVSVKIDYERNTGDDHIILITGFDVNAKLNFAQCSVQFHGASDDNFSIAPVTGSNIAQDMYNQMYNKQKNVDYGGPTDNAGRKSFGYIAQVHINAIASAVSKS